MNIEKELLNKINIQDISNIDTNNMFLHYTNINNLNSIIENGLQPRIGINSIIIEKEKKVFFSIGEKGALVIMDCWIKWLIAKPNVKIIYWIGAWLLKFKFVPKFLHNIIKSINNKSKNKKVKAYKNLKKILDNSIYLILDLKENVDFSFNDVDEIKKYSNFPKKYIQEMYAYNSDINNPKMEYWNMHTYSNITIKPSKISLLKDGNNYSANIIIQKMAYNNIEFVKENCKLLYEYLKFFKY